MFTLFVCATVLDHRQLCVDNDLLQSTVQAIEIGLEQAPFVFSAFEHVKSLLIMGPNHTKNSSLKYYFLIISYE